MDLSLSHFFTNHVPGSRVRFRCRRVVRATSLSLRARTTQRTSLHTIIYVYPWPVYAYRMRVHSPSVWHNTEDRKWCKHEACRRRPDGRLRSEQRRPWLPRVRRRSRLRVADDATAAWEAVRSCCSGLGADDNRRRDAVDDPVGVDAVAFCCYGPWSGTSWPVALDCHRNSLWTSTVLVVHTRAKDPSEPFSRGALRTHTPRTRSLTHMRVCALAPARDNSTYTRNARSDTHTRPLESVKKNGINGRRDSEIIIIWSVLLLYLPI